MVNAISKKDARKIEKLSKKELGASLMKLSPRNPTYSYRVKEFVKRNK